MLNKKTIQPEPLSGGVGEAAQAWIDKILPAQKAEDIFSIRFYQKEYAALIKVLHPDVCHLPYAGEAITRLNVWRREMEKYSRGKMMPAPLFLKQKTEWCLKVIRCFCKSLISAINNCCKQMMEDWSTLKNTCRKA